jgi:hypothetical protein
MAAAEQGKSSYNLIINESNQANLCNNENISAAQINSVFVFINPYTLESFKVDGLNIDIKIDDNGFISVNGKEFEIVEAAPGVKIFGILKR